MILKELDPTTATDALAKAGRRAEEQMAFYLRRAFAESTDVLVFNDIRLERNGEIAQIDHLILHRWGMVIIESKSVTSRVKINEREEWSRYWMVEIAEWHRQCCRQSARLIYSEVC